MQPDQPQQSFNPQQPGDITPHISATPQYGAAASVGMQAPTELMASQASSASAQPSTFSGALEYESNPFKTSITGLVTILQTNPNPALLVSLFALIPIVIAIIITILISSLAPIAGVFIGFIAYVIIIALVSGATVALASRSVAAESVTTRQLYQDSSRKVLSLVGATILIALSVIIGSLFLIVPGLILAAWFSLTYFVMFEENLGIIAAMKRSRQLVKGHIWEMLGALFAGQFLSGAGLLSPAASVAPLAGRYQGLKMLKETNAIKPKVHWLNYLGPVLFVILLAIGIGFGIWGDHHTNSTDGVNTRYNFNSSDYPSQDFTN